MAKEEQKKGKGGKPDKAAAEPKAGAEAPRHSAKERPRLRVRFEKDGFVIGFHRPHPAKEAKRHHIRDARTYLTKLGITA